MKASGLFVCLAYCTIWGRLASLRIPPLHHQVHHERQVLVQYVMEREPLGESRLQQFTIDPRRRFSI